MEPLDRLYGAGSSEAFRSAVTFDGVGLPDITEQRTRSGVGVEVLWDESLMRIFCTPENVNYTALDAPRRGLYAALVRTLPSYFRARGVVTFTAYPADAGSAKALRRRGRWRKREGHGAALVWTI